MTKHLDVAGDSYADIVVWRWERARNRWVANLRDGTELVVALQRFGHRSYWNAYIDRVPVPDDGAMGFRDPESAQKAAFAAWKRRQSPPSVDHVYGIKRDKSRRDGFGSGLSIDSDGNCICSEAPKPHAQHVPAAAVKLTKDQLAELKRLAHESQHSYGKGRVRVHNNLRRHGLARIDHSDGFMCFITPAGVDFLAKREARR